MLKDGDCCLCMSKCVSQTHYFLFFSEIWENLLWLRYSNMKRYNFKIQIYYRNLLLCRANKYLECLLSQYFYIVILYVQASLFINKAVLSKYGCIWQDILDISNLHFLVNIVPICGLSVCFIYIFSFVEIIGHML